MQISGLVRFGSFGKDMPSLMDSSPFNSSEAKAVLGESSSHDENMVESLETLMMASSSSYSSNPFDVSPASWGVPHQSHCSNHFMDEEQSMVGMVMENHGSRTHKDFDADMSSLMYNDEMFHRSLGNQEYSSPSLGHVYTSGLWGF